MGNKLIVSHKRVGLVNNAALQIDHGHPHSLIDPLTEKALSQDGKALNVGRILELLVKGVARLRANISEPSEGSPCL